MAVDERLDLKLSAADKQLFAQAAAIEGLSMAAFVRSAAKQRAALAIQQERQLRLSQQDFTAFQAAITEPSAPKPALQAALNDAANRVNCV